MRRERINLRIPGPTPLPDKVLKSSAMQMINHRAKQYEEMHREIILNLKYFLYTENEICLLTSSGMGGLEAAVVNFFSPGDKLAFFTCGEFGSRFSEIARRYGANVLQEKFRPGSSVDADTVYRALSENSDLKGIFFTHNETSTGVLNKLSDFAPLVAGHKNKPLMIVDSISALGAVKLPMDELGIDVLVSASQKAWMAPPGISFIAVSQRAWEKNTAAKMPRYYWDLRMYREFNLKNQTPATPAVGTLFGLRQSLSMLREESREMVFARHLALRDYMRDLVKKAGLSLFVPDEDASPTVTSILVPEGLDVHKLLSELNEKYRTVLAGGMGETKGKIIRIAHMGHVSKEDLDKAVKSLVSVLKDMPMA